MIYLPIMPTYLMRLICSAGTGNNLSDLLMHLACSDTPAIDLGHYLQPNPWDFSNFDHRTAQMISLFVTRVPCVGC